MKPLRIALIVYGLDRQATGIGTYCIELIKSLKLLKIPHKFFIFTAGGKANAISNICVKKVEIPKSYRYVSFVSLGNLTMNSIVKDYQIDIIHDLNGVAPFYFARNIAKTIVTIHDVFPWSFPKHNTFFDTLVYRYWLPYILQSVDKVITPSYFSKNEIIKYLDIPEEKIKVVYHGIDNHFRPVPSNETSKILNKYKIPEKYILFVGSIEKRKNIIGLIKACELAWARGIRNHLVIVGPTRWQYQKILQNIKESEFLRYIHYLGFIAKDDMSALYSGAKLLVFPSFFEGFGFPPLEAMACATPVITSNTTSLSEIVSDAAIQIDPYDIPSLSKEIELILTNSEIECRYIKRGLDLVKEFEWVNCAQAIVKIYESMI